MTNPFRPARYEDSLVNDELRDFHVRWLEIKASDVDAFESRLATAEKETEIQQFLEKHPVLLIQHLGGGHGRWVIPRKRLGSEHVTDFVIGDRDSVGFEWVAVELESPKAPLFNQNGDPSAKLNHAIRQITDWRSWLKKNQTYAARPPSESGLGLTDIDPNLDGLILIGRRSRSDKRTNGRRREMATTLRIRIHTYDWLIEKASGRLSKRQKAIIHEGKTDEQ